MNFWWGAILVIAWFAVIWWLLMLAVKAETGLGATLWGVVMITVIIVGITSVISYAMNGDREAALDFERRCQAAGGYVLDGYRFTNCVSEIDGRPLNVR